MCGGGKGTRERAICSSYLELQRDKPEDIENNICISSIHKNILEGYTRKCQQLLPLEKTRELKTLFVIYALVLFECVLFVHFINTCAFNFFSNK